MKIGEDHIIEGVTLDLIKGGNDMPIRRAVVIHFTSGATAKSSINFWRSKAAKGASAHVIIDRDGTIIQCRPFDKTCGHAGVSRWKDPCSKRVFSGMNSCSIGIELANAGEDDELTERWSNLPPLVARHRNGGNIEEWEKYTNEQLDACFKVTRAVVDRYNLDDIVGHEDIAPERKNDPGPAFPMELLRKHCGFTGLPKVHWP